MKECEESVPHVVRSFHSSPCAERADRSFVLTALISAAMCSDCQMKCCAFRDMDSESLEMGDLLRVERALRKKKTPATMGEQAFLFWM
jgi:hypothetical protein